MALRLSSSGSIRSFVRIRCIGGETRSWRHKSSLRLLGAADPTRVSSTGLKFESRTADGLVYAGGCGLLLHRVAELAREDGNLLFELSLRRSRSFSRGLA